MSPIFFGLAMAMKQTPWIVLPFVLIGLFVEHRRRTGRWGWKRAGQYLGISAAVFAIPNLPYVISAPHQWVDGVLAPFINHTVPAGQGLIGVSLFLHIGGGSLTAYTVTALVVLVSLAAVYACSYPLMRGWTFVLPSLVLYFAARSFGSYLIMLAPIALLAAATAFRPKRAMQEGEPVPAPVLGPDPPSAKPWRFWPAVVLGGLVISGVAVAWTLTSAPPLSVSVKSVHTTGQLATVERITVAVHNNTRAQPHRHLP